MMMMMGVFTGRQCCILLLQVLVLAGCALATQETYFGAEHRLFVNLTSQYQKEARPVRHPSEAVPLSFGISLLRIQDLDERSQSLSTNVWMRMLWPDPRLTWNPALFDGLKSISIPANKLWIPDITLYNMAQGGVGTSDMSTNQVMVDYNGTVVYVPHRHLVSSCLLDMEHFPYDTQNCTLMFGSWTYHSDKVKLAFYDKTGFLDVSSFSPHSEWELLSHNAVLHSKVYDCCPEAYQDIAFSLLLRRRHSYYRTLFVAPSIILLFLTPTVFWLPPDCSEKVTLGTGVMVSQVLLLVMVENIIPSAHPVVPVIGRFYLFGFVMAALSLALAVVVRTIWSQSNRRKPVPALLRTMVLGLCGRLLCISRENYAPVQELQDTDHFQDQAMAASVVTHIRDSSEWRQLAAILDKLLFFVFVALSVIVMAGMWHA